MINTIFETELEVPLSMPDQQFVHRQELQRIIQLSELDLDYAELNDSFKDLVRLSAQIAGTQISLINLIDTYTQWTVSGHGMAPGQTPRKDSICQHTIMQSDQLEVHDLVLDERFKDLPCVKEDPHIRYYLGVPLRTKQGHNIGALCVVDRDAKTLPTEKIELLKIIATEIVNRLVAHQVIQSLHEKLEECKQLNRRVAHDIRGPVGGIIGLADMVLKKGGRNSMPEVLNFMQLIQKSGGSLLEMADEILNVETSPKASQMQLEQHELTLQLFKERLEELYQPQATDKGIAFKIELESAQANSPFPKKRLMQIAGNLISNAFKFTPPLGSVMVKLSIENGTSDRMLHIQVRDSGIGLTAEQVAGVLSGKSSTTLGTKGEQGYGLGLALVKHLLDSLQGTMQIDSTPGEGTTFDLQIPIGVVPQLG